MKPKRQSPPKRRGVKKATTISVHSEKQISAMIARFRLIGPILTYRDLREKLNQKFGVRMSIGTVYRMANGHDPQKANLCHTLGLPVTVPVAVCEHCGKPPLSRRHVCADAPKKPRPKRRNWKGLALVLAGLVVNGRI